MWALTHFGEAPRPTHVCSGFAGLAYFGSFGLDGFLAALDPDSPNSDAVKPYWRTAWRVACNASARLLLSSTLYFPLQFNNLFFEQIEFVVHAQYPCLPV